MSNRFSTDEPCASVSAKVDPGVNELIGVAHDHIRGAAPNWPGGNVPVPALGSHTEYFAIVPSPPAATNTIRSIVPGAVGTLKLNVPFAAVWVASIHWPLPATANTNTPFAGALKAGPQPVSALFGFFVA